MSQHKSGVSTCWKSDKKIVQTATGTSKCSCCELRKPGSTTVVESQGLFLKHTLMQPEPVMTPPRIRGSRSQGELCNRRQMHPCLKVCESVRVGHRATAGTLHRHHQEASVEAFPRNCLVSFTNGSNMRRDRTNVCISPTGSSQISIFPFSHSLG